MDKINYNNYGYKKHHHFRDEIMIGVCLLILLIGIAIGIFIGKYKSEKDVDMMWGVINLTPGERIIIGTNNRIYFRRKCVNCGNIY